jgi:seryl-tRNA synthetase
MIDLKILVGEGDRVRHSLFKRNNRSLLGVLEQLVELDKKRRSGLQEVESLKAKRNEASQEISKLKKNKQDDSHILEEMKTVSKTIKDLDETVGVIQEKINQLLFEFPNLVDSSVPEGAGSEQNQEIRRWGDIRKFDFPVRSHDEIGEKLGILDFKKAGEVTGSRFVFLKGIAARLEMALIQFMYHTHIKAGYEPIIPPFIVNRASLTGTGQLPKFEEDVFRIDKVDYFLTPTAEVPVTNYHRDEILEEKDLPKYYVAYSPCFRSEAGSYGKDTKGLKRQHQFNKVELVKFSHPDKSMVELDFMAENAEAILKMLKLPYRTMLLCGGDMGFSSTKTYDIEVWSPYLNAYMEISSCSNCTDFQARRANIRFRDAKSGKVHFVHTLNGSGLAVGRTLLAIIENYQNSDGTFEIPEVLKPYF